MSTGTPVDILLEAFRRWKPKAYVCCPAPGRWVADCPACLSARRVRISEHGDGGPVAARCLACSASQQGIVDALLSAIDPKRHGQAA